LLTGGWVADAGGVKSGGARPLAAATLSEEVKPIGTEEGNCRWNRFNCGCNGIPAELAGRDGGLEEGFEENGGPEWVFMTPVEPGPTEDGNGKDERGGCEMSSWGSIFIALSTLSSSFIDDAQRFLDSWSEEPAASNDWESAVGRNGGIAPDLDRFGGEARAPEMTGGEDLSLGGLGPSANLVAAISSETSAIVFLSWSILAPASAVWPALQSARAWFAVCMMLYILVFKNGTKGWKKKISRQTFSACHQQPSFAGQPDQGLPLLLLGGWHRIRTAESDNPIPDSKSECPY
jgi:hypothetical protein